MNRSKKSGWLLMLFCLVAAASLLVGIFYRNYWALAIPVVLASLAVLGLGFWIGWTIVAMEAEPTLQPPDREDR